MSEPDPLAWLDGDLEEIGVQFAIVEKAWREHLRVPLVDEEAATLQATLLAAQMASVRWCIAALRREGVDEQALAPLVRLVGSLDLLLKGRPDAILRPVARPVSANAAGIGCPAASGRDGLKRAVAVYATSLLASRKVLKWLEADEWVAGVFRSLGVKAARKTIGDWRRNPRHYLAPPLAEEVERMLAAVPAMDETDLYNRLRRDIRAAISS